MASSPQKKKQFHSRKKYSGKTEYWGGEYRGCPGVQIFWLVRTGRKETNRKKGGILSIDLLFERPSFTPLFFVKPG